MAKKGKGKPAGDSNNRTVATNRKARHDYILEETFEAGLALTGSEIKSIRAGSVNLAEAYVQPKGDEMWLINCHIAPYDPASRENHDPRRPRKLLLHKREIARLSSRAIERGYTIVPTRMYLKHGLAKVEIALARGKRQYDKRATLAREQSQRDIERALRQRSREY
ncbi:MAG: SsrA-binding protein SmpB [Anaerolineae bacterium]